jgi:hypothetical protein
VYVIGGIVDRSVRKELTLSRALEYSIPAMRLPIQEYLPYRRTHILNIDTVVDTVCTYLALQDWTATLQRTVPVRVQIQGGKPERREQRKNANTTDTSTIDTSDSIGNTRADFTVVNSTTTRNVDDVLVSDNVGV